MSRRLETGCTIEVEHTNESFHAHLALDGDVPLRPGDKVLVHGAPVEVPFGGKITLRRQATVTRAGWLARQWTKFKAGFELSELYEVSFSTRRTL